MWAVDSNGFKTKSDSAFIVIVMGERYLDSNVKWCEHWSLKVVVRIESAGGYSASLALGRQREKNVLVLKKDSKSEVEFDFFVS